ncbi:hypothetical protein ACB098_04G062000 [Castanea mollissima]
MKTKTLAYSFLVLRILTLMSIIASILVLVTNKNTTDDIETSFKDIIAYRYVVAVASIGEAYTLLQLPFAMYYAHKEKRLIRNSCLPEFDFYGDKIICLLLATAVGASFAVSSEFHRFSSENLKRNRERDVNTLGGNTLGLLREVRNFVLGNTAAGVLLVGTVCMAVVSVLSSIDQTSGRGFFR